MIAKEIQEDDEFWDGNLLVWVALGDANIVTIDNEDLAVVPVKYMQDGGRDHRYFEPDQEVRVRRGGGVDAEA